MAQEVASIAARGTETEIQQLVEEWYRRALVLGPDDPRIIVNLDVKDVGDGNFQVLVASVQGS